MRFVVLRSLSDSDRSTAANDPRPSASFSARYEAVAPRMTLVSRFTPHISLFLGAGRTFFASSRTALPDRLLDDRKTCPSKKTPRLRKKRSPPASQGCSNVSLSQPIAAPDALPRL